MINIGVDFSCNIIGIIHHKINTVFCIFPLLIFTSCSWQEYFLITNNTNNELTIEYELDNMNSGFAIFDIKPSIYKSDSDNGINWNQMVSMDDKDTAIYFVKVILPPNHVLVFGSLQNDNYKKHDQKFINNRIFNLKNMKISNKEYVTEIIPEHFDDSFKKKNGYITYVVR